MLSFFTDVMYYIALAVTVCGLVMYFLSYFARVIPVIAQYALLMQILGVILALGGAYYVADQKGYQRRVAEDKAEIERLNGEARAAEAEYAKKLAVATTALRKAKNDVQTKKSSLIADADSGKLRLPKATCGLQTDPGSSTQPGNTANESESERQTVKELVNIASDGDTAIISLNACIKQYNEVRELVNKGVK